MPLFSEHIANMYYGSSSPYTGLPYGYSSSASPIGTSYSASYLNPGGSYSNHSSIGSYSRAPLSSRWITSSGRNYSPMLSTISERSTASPIRISSPRRLPLSSRTYGTPTPSYIPRPVNINTADIDVSRDRYRHRVEPPVTRQPVQPPPVAPTSTPPAPTPKESTPPESTPAASIQSEEIENGPFMPRVDGGSESGMVSSLENERSTIKRGRTVVRLYTIKRKERDSPRKQEEQQQSSDNQGEIENTVEDVKKDDKEFMKWREKLSDDLTYIDKKEKKSLGAKLVEKFILKDDKDSEIPTKVRREEEYSQSLPTTSTPNTPNDLPSNKSLDRRCSVDLLAEQANLFDSLIRGENLSTATLDLTKVGIVDNKNLETFKSFQIIKRTNSGKQYNALKTTKSDYSLHDSLNSYKDVRDPRNHSKKRSLKKSLSGSSLRRLDSITEFPKESSNVSLPAIDESTPSVKQPDKDIKPKPKLKTKITGSVEVSTPASPLKIVVGNITVEEITRLPKKEITYSSEVEEVPTSSVNLIDKLNNRKKDQENVDTSLKTVENSENQTPSPEPESGNFWDKIGKRETVYLMKRKQNIAEAKEKNKRALFWFPEEEDQENCEGTNNVEESNVTTNKATEPTSINVNNEKDTKKFVVPPSNNKDEDNIINQPDDVECSIDTTIKIDELNKQAQNNNDVMLTSNIDSNSSIDIFEDSQEQIPLPISKIEPDDVKDSSKQTETNTHVSTPKRGVGSDLSNIGKSSSLDIVSKDKVKVSSQKKTKSEKTKKVITDNKSEIEIPKPNLKKKSSDKLKLEENVKDLVSESQDKTIVMNKAHEDDTKKKDSMETIKKPKTPCPIHPFGLKKLKEPNKELANEKVSKDKIENHSNKANVPAPIHTTDQQKVKEVIPTEILQNSLFESQTEIKTLTEESEKSDNKEIVKSDIPLSNDNSMCGQELNKINRTSEEESKDVEINKTQISPTVHDSISTEKTSDLPNIDKTDNLSMNVSKIPPKTLSGQESHTKLLTNTPKVPESGKVPLMNKPTKLLQKNTKPNDLNKVKKTDGQVLATQKPLLESEVPSTSSGITAAKEINTICDTKSQTLSKVESSSTDSSLHTETKISPVPDTPVALKSQDIPVVEKLINQATAPNENKTGEEIKAESNIQLDEQKEKPATEIKLPLLATKKPVKEEKAIRPLIATPRPLQKKAPQVIHSSDSSDSSSEEESSEEDDDSDSSEGSGEFFECENNPDGRTSTGSNDSGFDSSAPASPATFSQIKKGGEATAASSSATSAQHNNTDILEQDLELSTAYDIFRKTGRFTPPARSIPRFRKYTIEDFQFIKVLGKGSFGKVLLAELRDTEYYYAVKCLKKDVVLEDDDVECTLIERKVLALGTNHPYLCHLFATFQTDSHLFFVMEYLNGGDLMFHIQQSGRFPEARARFYAAEIVSGLKFLHKRGIVYRDLKLDNILLDFEGHVRIADFGMCKLQIYLEKTADTFCGTPDYMAPEIIKGLKYNQTVDWWSFGVLLYEMLIGQSPFSGCDEDELFWSICNEMPSYPRFLSQQSLTILTRLLDKDARTRLGGTECMHGDIRDQEFFHQIHWDKLERRELETPFRPRVRHPMDTQYFDRAFTGERPRLTAVEPHVLRSMDQEPFRGFSYTNPNTTDR